MTPTYEKPYNPTRSRTHPASPSGAEALTMKQSASVNKTRGKTSRCSNCGYIRDHHTSTTGVVEPKDGDISMCLKCGYLGVFNNNRIIPLSAKTYAELDEDTKSYLRMLEERRKSVMNQDAGLKSLPGESKSVPRCANCEKRHLKTWTKVGDRYFCNPACAEKYDRWKRERFHEAG